MHAAYLEERSGAEDAVVVGFVKQPVNGTYALRCQVERRGGAVSEFTSPIVPVRLEGADERCGGAHADLQFLQCVVVDRVELDIFVAVALAGVGVGAAEKVQIGARCGGCGGGEWDGRRLCFGRVGFRGSPRRILSLGEDLEEENSDELLCADLLMIAMVRGGPVTSRGLAPSGGYLLLRFGWDG